MPGWPFDETPYHAGERSLQTTLGVRERAERMGRKGIRDFMPDQHRELFERLPLLLIGSLDSDGRPWASVVYGPPGFVRSPDPRTLSIAAQTVVGDSLFERLAIGSAVGVLGIQLETRRRNRMNGRVTALDERAFAVRVDQSFGNCPQYIQAREPELVADVPTPEVRDEGPRLSESARRLIARSDTCFIASASSAAPSPEPHEGVDVSHRGGRPGFVHVGEQDGAHVLTMPDFAGNNAFNTLGNVHSYARAGLLFIDFETGDLLTLTGEASLVLAGSEVESFFGAERLLKLRVETGRFIARALPLRWSQAEPARELQRTGSWTG